MKIRDYQDKEVGLLWRQEHESSKFDNGQVAIVGGSELFHGAPMWALKAASRMVDMVYFACPEVHKEAADRLKAEIGAFIWVPFDEAENYIAKTDAALIGPGLLRFRSEKGIHSSHVCDGEGKATRELSLRLFSRFREKKWVVDGGSLQVVEPEMIPKGAVVTPNAREFEMLFKEEVKGLGEEERIKRVNEAAGKYGLTVVLKGVTTIVANGEEVLLVKGGSAGLTKGGTGDLIAGLTVGMLAKNEAMAAAAAANLVVKRAAETLERERDLMYSIDDVAEEVPKTWKRLISQA